MYVIDEAAWPILVVRWEGVTAVGDMEAFLAWLDTRIQRARAEGVRIAVLHDAFSAGGLPADARRVVVEWGKAHDDGRDVVAGHWIVNDSALIRGVLTALRWMMSSLSNVHVAATKDQALAQARVATAMPRKAAG